MQSPELKNYNDLSALQSLKTDSNKNSREGIRAVAEQFESMFISMMLKSMRDANKGFSEGNMLSSNETEFYQEMFDSQIAVSLSSQKGGGFGMADVIERQILASKGMSDAQSQYLPMSISDYQRKDFPALRSEGLLEAVAKVDEVIERETAAPIGMPTEENMPITFDSPDAFVKSLLPIAKTVERETGISASLMIAQSALETGWGQKPIVKQDGTQSFNMFGIKANHGWSGDTADIVTTEFHQGIAIKQRDVFRAYGSFQESFQDYAEFLRSNPRYENALAVRGKPVEFAKALQASGYATDPNYAVKIERILHSRLSDVGQELDAPLVKSVESR